MRVLTEVSQTVKTKIWWLLTILVMVNLIEVTSLSGPNVCMVKQKYNITKRVKYRAPMSVRTYEWCFAMPPRCSKWNTEMRDVTRLETEERTAEMAVCCPGYKLRDVSCVPHCPSGKTGTSCSEDCPPNKWGPSCMHECKKCGHGSCDPTTGVCRCQDGWQGESCETSMITTVAVGMMEQTLTTVKPATPTKTTTQTPSSSTTSSYSVASTVAFTPLTTTHRKQKENETEITTHSILPNIRSLEESSFETETTRVIFLNTSISTVPAPVNEYEMITDRISKVATGSSHYNRTEPPIESAKTVPMVKLLPTAHHSTTVSTKLTTEAPTSTLKPASQETTIQPSTESVLPVVKPTQNSKSTTALMTTTETTLAPIKIQTKKTETTMKQSNTTKSRPKEIWIRPTQKGESPSVESKLRQSQELPHPKTKTKELSETTTPKTIIVSIIPTSVSYTTFKKIVLSAVSASQKNDALFTKSKPKAREQGFTKPMIMHTTSSPVTVKVSPRISSSTTMNPVFLQNITKTKSLTSSKAETFTKTTNSMSSTLNASKRLNSSQLTTFTSFPTNASSSVQKQNDPSTTTTSGLHMTTLFEKFTTVTSIKASVDNRSISKQSVFVPKSNFTAAPNSSQGIEEPKTWKTKLSKQANTNNKRNLTDSNNTTKIVTDDPTKDEETFHILTEPEHITAVMGDKAMEKSTIDLISVISIAGGVMMAIITVAVVIVMLERCKRPRYQDVRKYNDIRMQVMIDNKNDDPPPYVRSIFHTPLPDPPTSEKCHYQPISTLDRNLKQFMRPVVVQTISPLMLENFRGILECHYDHLPRRSQDIGTCCTMASSIGEREELLPQRIHSLSDSDIEALKCEAKLDVLDNTTSEPLYAEIPCWRPPSARAIEVVNLNGEAVTEL